MKEQTKGTCPHGEFILNDGCPECIAERQSTTVEADNLLVKLFKSASRHIVKVRYDNDATEDREYAYYSEGVLTVGDVVDVPTKNSSQKAIVTAINVPEEEVFSFKSSMKTILAVTEGGKQLEIESEISSEQEDQATIGVAPGDHEAYEAYEANMRILTEPETAVVRIKPQSYENIKAMFTEVVGIIDRVACLEVKDENSAKTATAELSSIATFKRAIQAAKKEFLDPIKTLLSDTTADFKLLLDPLEEADSILRTRVLAYREEEQRKVDEANAIAVKERELEEKKAAFAGEPMPIQPPVEQKAYASTHTKTDVGSTSTMGIAKWRVVDLALVPREYLMIDAAKVGKVVKASKAAIVIDGIEIWTESTLRVEAKKD